MFESQLSRVAGAAGFALIVGLALLPTKAPAGAPAGAPAADRYEDARASARAAMRTLREEGSIPGLQVAVAVDGRLVWSDALGFANLETRTPVTTRTKFRIASISKSLTGTLAARLARQGRFDLDAPVSRYLPSYPRVGRNITARQLAGHLSGIRHYAGDEMKRSTHYDSLGDALAIFCTDPLVHAPGTNRTYSTYGYTLLGTMMERAAGKPFDELMAEEILAPLGMTQTVPDVAADIIPGRTSFYEYDDYGGVSNAPSTDHSYKLPGGGYLSTSEDLVRFGAAMGEPGFLDEETIQIALMRAATAGRDFAYGMGWELGRDDAGDAIFGHRGTQPGARSYLYVNPRHDVVVAILTNVTAAPMERPQTAAVARLFIDAKKAERR